ncbi:hypothetical protein GDO81_004284 [Engystomops pustulosus]|uniref:MADF domain-containing protein n=1 Tax=Engystomops pustulosus TaxID=76066 RepID=A0AAV6ZS04_ENGPU|nr:hypothetical protein GDO81_004284 [Engystomops pustulosus]KAG8551817.1 hypothetical protein GDO81_004284 [Engystomops pustulosus]
MAFLSMERLIALVQENPILWDKRDESFCDRARKAKKWEEVTALLLPEDWSEAKTAKQRRELVGIITKRWTSARDQYKREKSQLAKSGSGSLKKKPYLYTKYMRFLDAIMDVGDTADNLEESPATEIPPSQDEPPTDVEDAGGEAGPSTQEPPEVPAPSTPPPARPSSTPTPTRSRRRRPPHTQERASVENVAICEILSQLRNRRDDSPEDVYLRGLSPELKKVLPHDMANCKAALFAVVQIFQKTDYPHKNEVALYLDRHRERVGGLIPPSPPRPTRMYPTSYEVPSHSQASMGGMSREFFDL